MFRQIVSQLANKVIVPILAKSKPFQAAAVKAHETVQAFQNSDVGKKFEEIKNKMDPPEGYTPPKKEEKKKPEKIGPEEFTMDKLKTMNIKKLQDLIKERGLTAPYGAMEKSEFIEVLAPLAREPTQEEEMEKVLHGAHDSIFGSFNQFKKQLK